MGTNYFTVGEKGCGLVAVYNVMKLIGKFQYFPNVIVEAEVNNMLTLGGSLGVTDDKKSLNILMLIKLNMIKLKQFLS